MKQYIVSLVLGFMLMAGNAMAAPKAAPKANEQAVAECTHHPMDAINFQQNSASYSAELKVFVVIDSVECAVDFLVREGNEMHRVSRYTTDTYKGRHDVKNILRPKSVAIHGNTAIVLVSSSKDSSYLSVISLDDVLQGKEEAHVLATVGFACKSYAFAILDDELMVAGQNALGYDINTLSIADGIDHISLSGATHYHVPLQAERIKDVDPKGTGVSAVAVAVVFLALLFIFLFFTGSGKFMRSRQEKGKDQPSQKNHKAAKYGVADDVYAAIAAAIYMYGEELHDEEDRVITIQKVERAWTPWNAKFYNMNPYPKHRK